MGEKLTPFRILFMGTPDFAALILKKIQSWPHGKVAGVITQPDRRAGRGKQIRQSPVKATALHFDLPLLQPTHLKSEIILGFINEVQANVLVVAAYGLMIPPTLLKCTRYGALNVHASLLPKYRGAAPIQWALINGEKVTGITIMEMQPGLDTGPILFQKALAIDFNDTAQSLHDQMAELGGNSLIEALENWIHLQRIPQDSKLVCYAPKLTKQDGLIDWNQPAEQIHNRIRGVHPWPGAFFFFRQNEQRPSIRLGVFPGRIGPAIEEPIAPGRILGLEDQHLVISCADRYYLIDSLQPASGRIMSASEFQCGYLS